MLSNTNINLPHIIYSHQYPSNFYRSHIIHSHQCPSNFYRSSSINVSCGYSFRDSRLDDLSKAEISLRGNIVRTL
uniref:Uncharacterized protein n=1 Tax=Arion vulgaris TaxID=1028688 RepID=A0A0B7AY21_9EUPU